MNPQLQLLLEKQLYALFKDASCWLEFATQPDGEDIYKQEAVNPPRACCDLFFNRTSCTNCPIAMKTGVPLCVRTPYQDFRTNEFAADGYVDPRLLAQQQHDFLLELAFDLVLPLLIKQE